MNKSERERIYRLQVRLCELGFTYEETEQLRKCSKTLSRWCERECNGEIERREDSGKPYSVLEQYAPIGGEMQPHVSRFPIPDREAGAKKRINSILSSHPGWAWYYQTDPRGVAVYLYTDEAITASSHSIDCVYSSIGIAVY